MEFITCGLMITVAFVAAPLFFILGYVWGINEPCMFCRGPDDDRN